jgi:hypothetical protein
MPPSRDRQTTLPRAPLSHVEPAFSSINCPLIHSTPDETVHHGVGHEFLDDMAELSLAEKDEVIQTLVFDGFNKPLSMRVGPL